MGTNIAKATLKLYVNKVNAAGTFDVYRVAGAWTELGITAASAPALGRLQPQDDANARFQFVHQVTR